METVAPWYRRSPWNYLLLVVIMLVVTSPLTFCAYVFVRVSSEISAATDSPEAAPEPEPAPSEDVATYDILAVTALERLIDALPLTKATLMPAADTDPGCEVRVARKAALTTCAHEGRLTRILVVPRGDAGLPLSTAVRAVALTVAPDTESADLARVVNEAAEAVAEGRTMTVCPTIRCFRVSAIGQGWAISATADQ